MEAGAAAICLFVAAISPQLFCHSVSSPPSIALLVVLPDERSRNGNALVVVLPDEISTIGNALVVVLPDEIPL